MSNACYIQKQGDKNGPTKLYEVKFRAGSADDDMSKVEYLEILGQEVDTSDYEVMARAFETIRKHNEAVHSNHYSSEGKLLSDIMNETRLIPYLYRQKNFPSYEDGGISEMRILGGENQNQAAVAPDRERSIGANSAAVTQKGIDRKGEFQIIQRYR